MGLKKEQFDPLLNKKFKITFDAENQYEAELIEIKSGKPIPDLELEPFSLMFRAKPDEKIFVQGLYSLYEESLGEIKQFMIPRKPDEEGVYYEIIIQ